MRELVSVRLPASNFLSPSLKIHPEDQLIETVAPHPTSNRRPPEGETALLEIAPAGILKISRSRFHPIARRFDMHREALSRMECGPARSRVERKRFAHEQALLQR
jgi:hypothetical protein